jgi:serine/threonine-protein kinase HipA
MLKCDIRITFPDGDKVLCGTILCQDPDPRGWIEGAFRYAPGYLDDPRAFPLDPEVLPLSNREFQAKRSTGVHAVFQDCLPDDWGRRLLVRKANLERTKQNVPQLLLALGGSGLGALSYESIEDNKIHNAELLELPDILEAALCFEQGKTVSDEGLNALFRAGSSPSISCLRIARRAGSRRKNRRAESCCCACSQKFTPPPLTCVLGVPVPKKRHSHRL